MTVIEPPGAVGLRLGMVERLLGLVPITPGMRVGVIDEPRSVLDDVGAAPLRESAELIGIVPPHK